jgi:hypothetical protein
MFGVNIFILGEFPQSQFFFDNESIKEAHCKLKIKTKSELERYPELTNVNIGVSMGQALKVQTHL